MHIRQYYNNITLLQLCCRDRVIIENLIGVESRRIAFYRLDKFVQELFVFVKISSSSTDAKFSISPRTICVM